jgi:stage IV sporulation protein FB
VRIAVLSGIPVYLNPYFLVMIAGYVAAGLGPQVLLLFLLVTAHEFAHLLVARVCGVEVFGVELFPFGGMARTGGMPADEPLVEAVVATAGPLNNFLLYGAGLALLRARGEAPLVSFYLDANMSLALFNMIPALPLDGGRILRAFLAQSVGYGRASAVLTRAGKAMIMCLLAWGLTAYLLGEFVPNAFAFAFFLFVAGRREAETSWYLVARSLLLKREALKRRRMIPIQHAVALGSVKVKEVCGRFTPNRQHLITVMDQSMNPLGQVWEIQVLDWLFAGKGEATLGDIVRSGPADRPDGKPT